MSRVHELYKKINIIDIYIYIYIDSFFFCILISELCILCHTTETKQNKKCFNGMYF